MQRNRLAAETSPYLQQHADNPVDWYPWGEEALERARREDKPILLSVGYSACHWCHVMAHESFEDPATAAVMNHLFVNIKVDREERPGPRQDLSARTAAAHAARGRLAADHVPDARRSAAVFRRHVFPARAALRHAGLQGAAASAWPSITAAHGAEIRQQKAPARRRLRAGCCRTRWPSADGGMPRSTTPRSRSRAPRSSASFDRRFGGFGAAPKFPHPEQHRALPARRRAPDGRCPWPRSR